MIKSGVIFLLCIMLCSCGTFTPLTTHGGGKRFAIEQELIATSIKACLNDLDISKLKGKKTYVKFSAIGDQGAGNMIGGGLSPEFALRGGYISDVTRHGSSNYADVIDRSFDVLPDGTIVERAIATGRGESPDSTKNKSKGDTFNASAGVSHSGRPQFNQSTIITNGGDMRYLTELLRDHLIRKGVAITDKGAEIALLVSIDTFGIIRSKTDWLLFNSDSLEARTRMEYSILDFSEDGSSILQKPVSVGYGAKYTQEFRLWMGPVKTSKHLIKLDNLLADFSKIDNTKIYKPTKVIEVKDNSNDVDPKVLKEQGLIE